MRKSVGLAFFSLFLLVTPLKALAIDYSDVWSTPGEGGWGLQIVQSDNFIFMTFYIYDANKQPTWYAGNITSDGNGNFTGGLYATTGPYFGTVPYVTPQNPPTLVGSVTFTPQSADTGLLSYNVGAVKVTKNIQRFTLQTIALGGTYSGGQSGAYSGGGCVGAGGYIDHFDLQVNQPGDGTVTLQFSYTDSNMSCTMSGTLQQVGMLYSVPNATYNCSTGLKTNASMSEIKATSLGIEGRLAAPSVGGGCREDAIFSAVLQ